MYNDNNYLRSSPGSNSNDRENGAKYPLSNPKF